MYEVFNSSLKKKCLFFEEKKSRFCDNRGVRAVVVFERWISLTFAAAHLVVHLYLYQPLATFDGEVVSVRAQRQDFDPILGQQSLILVRKLDLIYYHHLNENGMAVYAHAYLYKVLNY